MAARGPGDPPPVVRRRAARVKRKERQQQRVRQQAQGARPLSSTPVRPTRPIRVPRAAQRAKPLASQPVRPQRVAPARMPRQARPLAATPQAQRDMRPSRPVRTQVQKRGVQRAAYDQLSAGAKRAHLKAARQRLEVGKATDYDKTILHAHTTRVQGSRRQVARARNTEAAYLSQGDAVERAARRAEGKLTLAPGFEFGKTRHGSTDILDPKGRKVGESGSARRTATSVANLKGPVALAAPVIQKALEKTPAPQLAKNAAKDVAELATGAPTAYAKFAVDLATNPKKAAREVVEPVKEVIKDPVKAFKERPVSTALMVTGPVRGVSRAANTAARRVGVQTSARPVRELPGTPIREVQPAARGVVHRAVETRRDVKKGNQRISATQLDRRVDEEYAAGQRHRERVTDAIIHKQAKDPEIKKLPKRERHETLAEYRGVAHQAAKGISQARFGRLFGATAERLPDGRIADRGGTEARLHATREEAQAVADHLNAKSPTMKRGHGRTIGGDPAGRLYAKENVPVDFVPYKAGDLGYAVVPRRVNERLNHHEGVGTGKQEMAKVLRETRGMFTRAVLPYTPTWLAGQAIEGGVRAAIAGAGPTSYLRGRAAVRGAGGKALMERATPGGIATRTQVEVPRRTLHDVFDDSDVARTLTALGRKPGLKQVRDLNRKVTDFIFERFNAQFLEGVPQTAMLGKALRESPIMERGTGRRFDKALEDAGKGLTSTENQIAFGRDVQRMYGQYSGFGPKTRERIMHWTPFIPWYINSARFILSTLPRNHPLTLAVTADLTRATEEWRQSKGLSFRHPETRKPMFMMGGFPVSGSTKIGHLLGIPRGEEHIVRLGHYTPAGIATDLGGSTTDMFLPQFSGMYKAMLGLDWKDEPLKHPNGKPFTLPEKTLYGMIQLGEALTPLASKATDVYGVPLVGKSIDMTGAEDKSLALRKLIRPLSTVKSSTGGGAPGGPSLDLELSPTQLQSLDLG